ncbi:helix-turn-helix domain-containing protein [Kangiella shandongensis]|uniref:helix-turn-helix domain-containing protein n=1 Tax=Kangiella shandongensis TaxID=2763258 RepID=UPI001CBDAD8C|nr:AraC family transcriptional regulator [Kangiella shandongensis]
MESNYLGNLKVSDYAALTGRSLSTFTREFKRLYGTSPNKWLIQKRLEKSSELLEKTSMSVTEVAMEVGYENVSHFIKAYKRLFDTTPKRYKSENNG